MTLKLITGPASEPVTTAEVKTYLNIDTTDHDILLDLMIESVREYAENYMKRQILPATWELILDEFPDVIELPMPPVTSVTSIKYIDTDGTQQTMDSGDYRTDLNSEPARIEPAYGSTWPTTRSVIGNINIRYVSGYTNAAAVPESIKTWIKIRVGVLFENRENIIVGQPISVIPHQFLDGLLDQYRIISIA